jgi:hypothetical protein
MWHLKIHLLITILLDPIMLVLSCAQYLTLYASTELHYAKNVRSVSTSLQMNYILGRVLVVKLSQY